jgi:hypothetical protein
MMPIMSWLGGISEKGISMFWIVAATRSYLPQIKENTSTSVQPDEADYIGHQVLMCKIKPANIHACTGQP